jgi:hypothetical protein
LTLSTPGIQATALSTLAAQAAQVIPLILNFNLLLAINYLEMLVVVCFVGYN